MSLAGRHGVIVGALGRSGTRGTRGEVREFFGSQMPDAERTLKQAMERIDACAGFAAQQSGKLDAWLRSR